MSREVLSKSSVCIDRIGTWPDWDDPWTTLEQGEDAPEKDEEVPDEDLALYDLKITEADLVVEAFEAMLAQSGRGKWKA